MIALDTSVVVRYLVREPVRSAQLAARLIEQSAEVGIPILVLLETAHVLRSRYGVARTDIPLVLIDLLMRQNVRLIGMDTSDAIDALVRARSLPGTPIADALIAAQARSVGASPLYTFDLVMARQGVDVAIP